MGIRSFEVNNLVFLCFNEPDGYKIFQVQVSETEGRIEGDTLIQVLKFRMQGKFETFFEKLAPMTNNVESNLICTSFAEAWGKCDTDKAVYFYEFNGGETRLFKLK